MLFTANVVNLPYPVGDLSHVNVFFFSFFLTLTAPLMLFSPGVTRDVHPATRTPGLDKPRGIGTSAGLGCW
jgi:hypothetical protein